MKIKKLTEKIINKYRLNDGDKKFNISSGVARPADNRHVVIVGDDNPNTFYVYDKLDYCDRIKKKLRSNMRLNCEVPPLLFEGIKNRYGAELYYDANTIS